MFVRGVLIMHHTRVLGADCEDCDWTQFEAHLARLEARDHAANMSHQTRLYEKETTTFRGRGREDGLAATDS